MKNRIICKIRDKINNQKGLKSLSWLLSDNAIALILGLITSVLITRSLGSEKYGILSYCLALYSIWGCILSFGTNKVLPKEVVREEFSIGQLRGTSYVINMISSVIATIGAIGTCLILGETEEVIIYVAILSLVFFVKILFSIPTILSALLKSDTYTKWNIKIGIVMAIIKLVLVFAGGTIVCFVLCYLLEAILQMLAYEYIAKRELCNYRASFSMNCFKFLLRQSWPYIVWYLSAILYMRVDQVMIKQMIGADALGKYSVAVTWSDFVQFIPVSIATVMLPILTKVQDESKEAFEKEYSLYFERMLGTMICIVIGLEIFAPVGINLLYGSAFNEAVGPLRIYVISELFVSIDVAFEAYIIISLGQKKTMLAKCLAAIVNIILNYYLIPVLGCEGAALSTLVSMIFASIFMMLLWKDTRHLIYIMIRSLYFKGTRSRIKSAFLKQKSY